MDTVPDLAPDLSGIERVSQGDPVRARRLRANLAVYARRSDDPDTRDLVADVLAGRKDVGEVLRSEKFNAVAEKHLDHLQQGIEQLSPEEREQVFDQARDRTPDVALAALRDAGDPGDGWAPADVAPKDPALRRLT